jgi:hypothetical protein
MSFVEYVHAITAVIEIAASILTITTFFSLFWP